MKPIQQTLIALLFAFSVSLVSTTANAQISAAEVTADPCAQLQHLIDSLSALPQSPENDTIIQQLQQNRNVLDCLAPVPVNEFENGEMTSFFSVPDMDVRRHASLLTEKRFRYASL